MRRVIITMAAAALVVAAEVAATLNATVGKAPTARRGAIAIRTPHPPPAGEPELPRALGVPSGPRLAAVRFIRDYALWSSGRLPAMPARDATWRVTRLLEQRGRQNGVAAPAAAGSVRIARVPGAYVVTSAVGNFLVGKRGSRWLVISLPGD